MYICSAFVQPLYGFYKCIYLCLIEGLYNNYCTFIHLRVGIELP